MHAQLNPVPVGTHTRSPATPACTRAPGVRALPSAWFPFRAARGPLLLNRVYSQLVLPALRRWGHLMVCIPIDFGNENVKHGEKVPGGPFVTKMSERCLAYPRPEGGKASGGPVRRLP